MATGSPPPQSRLPNQQRAFAILVQAAHSTGAGLIRRIDGPPNWVFVPGWTVLFLMIAVAGYRTFNSKPRSAAMTLWAAQMVPNFAWPPSSFRFTASRARATVIVLRFRTSFFHCATKTADSFSNASHRLPTLLRVGNSSGVFTSTDRPKRSRSCGRSSPSSGFRVPTRTILAG